MQAIELLNEMQPMLLKAKIPASALSELEFRITMLNEDYYEKFLRCLEDIWLYQYREAVEIYGLLPEAQWKQFVVMGVTELREQQLLARALKNLRQVMNQEFINPERPSWERGSESPSGTINES